MGSVRFTSRIKEWTSATETKLDKAVLEMATDIHRVAGMNAPKLTRALVKSGRIKKNGQANYSVIYGGGSVPYGRIQELGGIIRPKKHDYLTWKDASGNWHRAKSVTIKAQHYLERAGDATSRNIKRYLKGI